MKKIKYFLPILFVVLFFSSVPSVSALSGTLSVSSYDVNIGEPFTITISGKNQTGGVVALYIYRDYNRNSNRMIKQFVGFGSPSEASRSISHREYNSGKYRYCGFVEGLIGYRVRGVEASPNCIDVNVGLSTSAPITNLEVSCYSSPNNPKIGQNITFISSVSGGTGSYSYNWSGACNSISEDCSRTFYSSGNYIASLRVESGNQSRMLNCSVNILNEDYSRGITSGNISVSSNSVYVGDTIRITVKGEDENGLISLGAYYKGDWNIKNVSGNNSQETWDIFENIPGTYNYCGVVRGKSQNGNIKTIPYCVNVNVLSRSITQTPKPINECSYVGETSCNSIGQRTVCVNENGVLKWKDQICSGDTSYGYGVCVENQRPVWSCKNGACVYNCVYDTINYDKIKIEKKDFPISLSILARKEGEEEWVQKLNVKTGERIEFLAVMKSNRKEGAKDALLTILPEENINFENYSQTINIGNIDNSNTETFKFFGKITKGEKENFEVMGKVQINNFEDNSKVEFTRESGEEKLATIGSVIGDLFGKWWFWILFLILLFLLFYFFRRKKQ